VSPYHPFLYYQYNHKFIIQFLSDFKWSQIGYTLKDVNRSHFQVMTRIPDEINVYRYCLILLVLNGINGEL